MSQSHSSPSAIMISQRLSPFKNGQRRSSVSLKQLSSSSFSISALRRSPIFPPADRYFSAFPRQSQFPSPHSRYPRRRRRYTKNPCKVRPPKPHICLSSPADPAPKRKGPDIHFSSGNTGAAQHTHSVYSSPPAQTLPQTRRRRPSISGISGAVHQPGRAGLFLPLISPMPPAASPNSPG